MTLKKLAILAATLGVTLIVAAGPAQPSGVPSLSATVRTNGSVVLIRANGKPVQKLRRGVYRIVVHDRSRRDNFDLVGPRNGLHRSTTIDFVGTVTWGLRLVPGIYRYGSDRLPKARASFRVV